ncbi:tetratricopeptide repeat protein [Acuticoccus sp. MNP-M23]|uniref:tetratricopeptide repeat protein n=1 Tax=Acuticoccus sp. MNP-M23 TaxID=3072793 RepID=UPI00281530AB|nr:tetratricopeptide repeat protein [Acuticoccus sp. MNP-M23]WMS44082.1 tetratricopeptide repeat protein [Acuticoccus sp. MNP-M23]
MDVQENDANPVEASARPRERVVTSPQEALQLAVEMHRRGNVEQAEEIYTAVLAHEPDNSSALQFLGVLRHGQGRETEALDLLQRATEAAPDSPGTFMNYGNVLLEAGEADSAVDAYKRMLELAPDHAGAWNNMGVLLRTLGRIEVAEEALRKAIALAPEDAGPWHNLGNLLLSAGRIQESVECALRSVTLLPESTVGRKLLGVAYAYLGEAEKAKAVFYQWLEETPDDPTALHHLAALEGRVPERASDAYVEDVFDKFAASFDSKLEMLEYRAPELVRDSLAAMVGDRRVSVLDVGCGTGLVGPLIQGRVGHLTGIDLSGKMLAKAKTRGVYDALEKAEFIAYLGAVERGFGAIIAADSLCYVGPMDAFSANALAALEPGGVMIGTFEADDDENAVTLGYSGRYTHGSAYLAKTFAAAGFEAVSVEPQVLRMEQGKPVHGYMLTARRPG